jgi:ectoine hydroxylase-related dioxygenase (phytanoyl-CoA dioxygenase family)
MDLNMQNKKYQPFLESLDELGFSTFKVFDDAEIDALKLLYEKHFGQKQINNLYASHNSNPIGKSLAINNGIREIVQGKLQQVFPDYNYFIGHYMVKGANTDKEFALHQDWNIVDEAQYKSYQVWIPLQLTYPENGGICVVPGSHRFFNNFRSGSYGLPFIQLDEKIKQIATDILVPSGSVLIYPNCLFHASHPNHTDEDRIAVIVNFVQKAAPTFYFHKNEQVGKTDLYPITGETLIAYLPQLEKGIVDSSFELATSTHLSEVNNSQIASQDLVNEFNKRFEHAEAAQLKQLHIAKDRKFEKQLNKEGYAIIDFLSDNEVGLFKAEYFKYFGQIDRSPGRFTTLQDAGTMLKRQMHNFIVKHIEEAMNRYFKDYTIPVSQFYIKKAFTSGDIDLHADSSLLLNHQLEPHYAIWVPLIDVDESNGTLTVIPHSHKINRAFFAASLGGYHKDHLDWLRKFEVPIKLKAGQAIIFDNNLLHNSTANKSAFDRLCITFRVTHFASQYYSFFCKNLVTSDSVEISEEPNDYYMNEQWDGNAQFVTGKHKGTYIHGITKIERDQLEQILSD